MTILASLRVLSVLLAATTAAAQAPNLLVNGSFEVGPGNALQAPSTAMTG